MDDFERIMDEADREGVKASQGIIKLLLKMWDGARGDVQAAISAAKRNRMVSVISALIAAACLCACFYQGTVIQRQGGEISSLRGEVESIHKILDAGVVIEETTTTEIKSTDKSRADELVAMSAQELGHGNKLTDTVSKMLEKAKAESNPCYATLAMVWHHVHKRQAGYAAWIMSMHEQYRR